MRASVSRRHRWLDPQVSVIKAGKELGTWVKWAADVSQHVSKVRVSGRREATGGHSVQCCVAWPDARHSGRLP